MVYPDGAQRDLFERMGHPPEGMEDAVQTVMTQCELWTDNFDYGEDISHYVISGSEEKVLSLVAENTEIYN